MSPTTDPFAIAAPAAGRRGSLLAHPAPCPAGSAVGAAVSA